MNYHPLVDVHIITMVLEENLSALVMTLFNDVHSCQATAWCLSRTLQFSLYILSTSPCGVIEKYIVPTLW